jgi:hypothetical protein
MVFMSDVRHTDVEVQNPSTLQQRLEAAQRQAAAEVADDEEAVNVEVGEKAHRPVMTASCGGRLRIRCYPDVAPSDPLFDSWRRRSLQAFPRPSSGL